VLPTIERTDPARTLIVPRVGPPASRSRLRFLLPWLVFGAVAVVVIAGSTLWSVALRTSAAGRATPDAAGIGTGAAPGPLAAAALPTTPAAATVTSVAALTSVRSPAPRPRAIAPPPAPARPAAVAPTSVVPPQDPAPTTQPDLVVCAEPGAEPPACAATSAPGSRSAARVTRPQQRSAFSTDTA
jgi:hypothetical protein